MRIIFSTRFGPASRPWRTRSLATMRQSVATWRTTPISTIGLQLGMRRRRRFGVRRGFPVYSCWNMFRIEADPNRGHYASNWKKDICEERLRDSGLRGIVESSTPAHGQSARPPDRIAVVFGARPSAQGLRRHAAPTGYAAL